MFLIVGLMALYLGGNNIKKAFALAPFGQWQAISWMLFVVGILMVLVGLACAWQANRDYKARQAELEEKEKAEKERRKQQFFYDDELEKVSAPQPENADTEDEI